MLKTNGTAKTRLYAIPRSTEADNATWTGQHDTTWLCETFLRARTRHGMDTDIFFSIFSYKPIFHELIFFIHLFITLLKGSKNNYTDLKV